MKDITVLSAHADLLKDFLRAIGEAEDRPGPIKIADLARRLGVAGPTMSQIANRYPSRGGFSPAQLMKLVSIAPTQELRDRAQALAATPLDTRRSTIWTAVTIHLPDPLKAPKFRAFLETLSRCSPSEMSDISDKEIIPWLKEYM